MYKLTFKAVIPKINIDPMTIQSKIEVQMIRFVNLVYRDFKETCATWKGSSRLFTQKTFSLKNSVRGEVLTGSKKYAYVNDGTKAHYVGPVNARMLRFRSKYTPKTSPGNLISRSGGSSGNRVFSRGHWVKGIQPRNFAKEIKALRERDFLAVMEKAFFEIAKDS